MIFKNSKIIYLINKYTNYHFNAEEKLLEKHQYESIEEHKEIHKNLIKIFNYKNDLASISPYILYVRKK
jgi:hemerythrin